MREKSEDGEKGKRKEEREMGMDLIMNATMPSFKRTGAFRHVIRVRRCSLSIRRTDAVS